MPLYLDQKEQDRREPIVGEPGTAVPETKQTSQIFQRGPSLQDYRQANRSASTNLAGRIGSRFGAEADTARSQEADYLEQVRQGLQGAGQKFEQGQGFLDRLSQIGQRIEGERGQRGSGEFGIEDFLNDPNFDQFQELRAGDAIDEAELLRRQLEAQDFVNQYLGDIDENQALLGSRGGIETLLSEAGGGDYSRGNAAFDASFLERDALRQVQEQVGQEELRTEAVLEDLGLTGDELIEIINQEGELIGDIDDQTLQNSDLFLDVLNSYVPGVNEERARDYEELQAALDSYDLPPQGPNDEDILRRKLDPNMQQSTGLTAEQLSRLGVEGGGRSYNVLPGIGDASDIAIRGRDAQDYQDVATEQDVGTYGQLADLAGIDPLRLQEASTLEDAYRARDDEFSLGGRLDRADEDFQRLLDEQVFTRGLLSRDFRETGRLTGTGSDLLERGIEGVQPDNPARQYRSTPQADRARANVYQQFLDFLNQQGYNNVVGQLPGRRGK